jgi:hypothetical protein
MAEQREAHIESCIRLTVNPVFRTSGSEGAGERRAEQREAHIPSCVRLTVYPVFRTSGSEG